MGQESLTRFDQPKKKKRPNKKPKQALENGNANNRPAIVNNKSEGAKNKPPGNNNRPKNKRPNPNNKSSESRKPIIITKNESKK